MKRIRTHHHTLEIDPDDDSHDIDIIVEYTWRPVARNKGQATPVEANQPKGRKLSCKGRIGLRRCGWLVVEPITGNANQSNCRKRTRNASRNGLWKTINRRNGNMSETVTIVHHHDGEQTVLRGSGYAVRCAAHIAHENLPDARWALKVLNTYGLIVRHEADHS